MYSETTTILRTERASRDYIHVMDLAEGHVKALKKFEDKSAVYIYNLGTGHGYSVLDVIHAFSKAVGKSDPVCDQAAPRGRYRDLLFRCDKGESGARLGSKENTR